MLPEAFVERLSRIIPAERQEEVFASFSFPQDVGVRVNTMRADGASVQEGLLERDFTIRPLPWFADAFVVPAAERARLLASDAFAAGQIYLQNPSSMVPPLVLAPEPGERVLDLAAAPGSKTLQMAAAMQGKGELAAVEVVKPRFFKLRANLDAQGAGFVRTFLKNGEAVWRNRPEYFDRVLLDAPCSTEGRFSTREPESFAYWSMRKVKEMAGKQQRLLYSAIQCARPGGVVVYSTCAFSPEENEAVIERVLSRFGDAVELEPAAIDGVVQAEGLHEWEGTPFSAPTSLTSRVLPNGTMEGFFVAKIRKKTSTLPAGFRQR